MTESLITKSSIVVSPNRSHGIITITYNSIITNNVQLNVHDKIGKLMLTKKEQATKGKNTY